MNDTLDVNLHDTELTDEIQLVTELMVVASEFSGPLSQAVIDKVLGIAPARPGV